jgi:hypothetical protein
MPKLSPEEVRLLKAAVKRVTVFELWQLLQLPHAQCLPAPINWNQDYLGLSPLRKEKNPSFSIFDGGRRWKDHGVNRSGDSADFLAEAMKVSPENAARLLIGISGVSGARHPIAEAPPGGGQTSYDPLKDEAKTRERAKWPAFETPTNDDLETIAEFRGLSVEGVTLAAKQRLLFCMDSREGRAWVIVDSERANAQARRLDGRPWENIKSKAWSLSGSVGGWPIGIHEAQTFPTIALTEGGPDILAAFHCIWLTGHEATIAPVTILGAGMNIVPAALSHFGGKEVRIFIHGDDNGQGQEAAKRWAGKLTSAGAALSGFFLKTDLNDFVRNLGKAKRKDEYWAFLRKAFGFTARGREAESNL